MGLSTLAIVPVFGSSWVEKLVKTIFFLNGLLGIGGIIGYTFDWKLSVMYLGLIVWNIVMPFATGPLIYYFKSKSPSEE